MSFDYRAEIPNPAEQAAVILEICEDNIHDAKVIAGINLKSATTEEDILYWFRVEQALISKQSQLVVAAVRPDERVPE